jgi:hypothetical protein
MSHTSPNLTTSQPFCCNTCGAAIALELINADDLAYVCQNRRCQRVVSVDCPEALHVRETLELPTRATVATLFV